jgi:hypothetical protein
MGIAKSISPTGNITKGTLPLGFLRASARRKTDRKIRGSIARGNRLGSHNLRSRVIIVGITVGTSISKHQFWHPSFMEIFRGTRKIKEMAEPHPAAYLLLNSPRV